MKCTSSFLQKCVKLSSGGGQLPASVKLFLKQEHVSLHIWILLREGKKLLLHYLSTHVQHNSPSSVVSHIELTKLILESLSAKINIICLFYLRISSSFMSKETK